MQVTVVEPSPSLGGEYIPQTRIIDSDSPFVQPDLEALRKHPNIRVITNAEVVKTKSIDGTYHLRIRQYTPRVDPEKCTACLICVRACPYDVPRINEEGVSETF